MDKISIVIPCFNEEEAIPVYYMEMKKIMKEMSYVGFELFFVDDGSSDRTLQELRALSDKDERCNYLSFSRNFGKEAAIYAGLSHITGNYGVVMDVDLQDPPALLAKCMSSCKVRIGIVLLRKEAIEKESRNSVLSYLTVFIKSLIKCQRQKLSMGQGISE